jgi:hypothetical protein
MDRVIVEQGDGCISSLTAAAWCLAIRALRVRACVARAAEEYAWRFN